MPDSSSAEGSADKAMSTSTPTEEPTLQESDARGAMPLPPAGEETSPKRQRKKRKRGPKEAPPAEFNGMPIEGVVAADAEDIVGPPEKSQAAEDCVEPVDAEMPVAGQSSTT